MSNPPPVRPWFRLTSIRPAPAPAPAPEPRPSLGLPTFRTASTPSSPQTHPTQPQEKTTEHHASSPPHKTSSSLPSSPVQKVTVTSSPPHKPSPPPPPPPHPTSSPEKTTTTTRVPSPTQSPRTIKQNVHSPMHSPKVKPSAPPPSPLTLPPSQLKPDDEHKIPMEAEPKGVLVQKTIDKPKPWHNGSGEMHRETRNHGNAHHGKRVTGKESETKEKKVSDSEDSGMRVITIAGENRGAYMELFQSPKKHESKYLHKKGNSNDKVDGGESESSSAAEEGNTNKKDKNHKGRTTTSYPMAAYMNSNVQCVNNSLLYHTSCSHHDPGVRLSLSKKPFGEGHHLKEHVNDQST